MGCELVGEGGHIGDKDRAEGPQVDSHPPPSPQGSGVPLHRHPEGESGHGTGGSGDTGCSGSTGGTAQAGSNGATSGTSGKGHSGGSSGTSGTSDIGANGGEHLR